MSVTVLTACLTLSIAQVAQAYSMPCHYWPMYCPQYTTDMIGLLCWHTEKLLPEPGPLFAVTCTPPRRCWSASRATLPRGFPRECWQSAAAAPPCMAAPRGWQAWWQAAWGQAAPGQGPRARRVGSGRAAAKGRRPAVPERREAGSSWSRWSRRRWRRRTQVYGGWRLYSTAWRGCPRARRSWRQGCS